MNWQWAVDQGLLPGTEANYYASGQAKPEEYSNAVKVAYENANDEQRKQLIDMLWSTGNFEGKKEHWYTFRPDEISDLTSAAADMGSSALAGTGGSGTGARFGIAGGAELWKNTTTGKSYIVYMVPGTEDDPVYMRWTVENDADVQSFFGPGQAVIWNKQIDGSDPLWADAVDFGGSDDLANQSENPFASWASTMAVQAEIQPWILDDDYQKMFAQALVEGREVTEAELKTTTWWKEHNDQQRKWMELYHGDPSSAEQYRDSQKIAYSQYMRDNGLDNLDPKLSNWMADKVTMGEWSVQEFEQQVQRMSDPFFADQPLRDDLQAYIDDTGAAWETTNDKENEVRNLVTRWLGSNFGNWDDSTVSEWAGRLRNETDGAEALTEILKDQRQALFPSYDREADYETIAAPWRNMIRNVWGEVPNDSDTMLHDIIRMNDSGEAGKFLTREGLARGNTSVINSVQSALLGAFGGVAR
jgi:hypothetical protein